jgi:hypothetical protein
MSMKVPKYFPKEINFTTFNPQEEIPSLKVDFSLANSISNLQSVPVTEAHSLYRFLDGKKIPASNSAFQAFS